MSEQPGQEPTAADTTVDPAPADQVQVTSSEDASAQQAPVDADVQPEPKAPAPVPSPPASEAKPTPPVPAPETKAPDADDLADLSQADLAKMIRDLRKENAADRTNAKTTAAQQARDELAQQIGKAIGLIQPEGEAKPPTPEELAERLTQTSRERDEALTEYRALQVKHAATNAASAHGADAVALMDSLSFTSKLQELNPSDDTFTTALDALVAKAVEDNPKYKVQGPAPTASSGDFSGGSGDKLPSRNDFDDFRKARRARSGVDF